MPSADDPVNCAAFRREDPFHFIVVSNLIERITRLYLWKRKTAAKTVTA
jgi:hypothetical protein